MTDQVQWKFKLTDSEKDLLKTALQDLEYDPNGHCQYINQLRIIAMTTLPRRILEVLVKQKASLSPLPYLMIENLPTDKAIFRVPIEGENFQHSKSSSISENLALAISSIVGEPYSISFEGAEIVNNLIPTKESVKDFTGLGSGVELDFHIENAALKYLKGADFSPLGLLLTGVNHDPYGPGTLVADGRAALKRLSEFDRLILKEARYRIKVPFRWREALGTLASTTELVPVIRDDCAYPDIAVAFYADIVEATDPLAKRALFNFYEAIRAVSVRLDIKPGMLITASLTQAG